MERRTFLTTGISAFALLAGRRDLWAAAPSAADTGPASATPNTVGAMVGNLARGLSRRPYQAPATRLPAALAKMDYDAYREVRFRAEKAVWHNDDLGFELQFFPAAYIYRAPVSIYLVEGGRIRKLNADRSQFDFGARADTITSRTQLGFSGFRIHAPINRRDRYEEFLVFQGASYFRGVGKDQQYGLSARALALNTVGPEPEEFPDFRSFWIERPETADAITVHALLDSPSVAGAFSFVIKPGRETTQDVTAVLYPRRDLDNVGIAPLTSMFLKSSHDTAGPLDFRPSIHDSDGLAAWNGNDERLWRPLLSPPNFEVSNFGDTDPKGFGLIQRERRFEEYQDLEARYELRPSAWVSPVGGWGAGGVELAEIPTQVEYDDNIVAYWRPEETLRAGQSYRYGYRLAWGGDVPGSKRMRVSKTRIGAGSHSRALRFVVDFAENRSVERVAGNTAVLLDAAGSGPLDAQLSSSAGTVRGPYVQLNPHLPGTRVVFELEPGEEKVVEIRLSLSSMGEAMSEVWLYRWCA